MKMQDKLGKLAKQKPGCYNLEPQTTKAPDEPEGVLAGVGFIKGGNTMAIKNAYLNNVYQDLAGRYADQKEFLQAVQEVLTSLEPVFERRPELEEMGIIERLVEPERSCCSGCPGWTTGARSRSTAVTGSSFPPPSAPPRAAFASTQREPVGHQVPGL